MDKIKEKRCYRNEMRADADSRHVEGYALVFDSWSEDLGFREIIRPGAVDAEVINMSDVLAVLNHNVERGVLARCKGGVGSLTLEVDDRGLRYAFVAPNTALGDELLENIRRGEIDSSSFCFTVKEDKWTKDEAGNYTREILRFERIYDVSPVYSPAYSATTVDLRGRDALAVVPDVQSDLNALEQLIRQY